MYYKNTLNVTSCKLLNQIEKIKLANYVSIYNYFLLLFVFQLGFLL